MIVYVVLCVGHGSAWLQGVFVSRTDAAHARSRLVRQHGDWKITLHRIKVKHDTTAAES